jgi:hypothetical protein
MTAEQAAAWMMGELRKFGALSQEDAASSLPAEWIYENEAGNSAISAKVLKEFNKLTGSEVVWERSARQWRPREKGDEPGRMQP